MNPFPLVGEGGEGREEGSGEEGREVERRGEKWSGGKEREEGRGERGGEG